MKIELKNRNRTIRNEFFTFLKYQRGYRWTQTNVNQLLSDIWDYRQESDNNNTFYCLQPVVVRKKTMARYQ